jgi:hypothetical protein
MKRTVTYKLAAVNDLAYLEMLRHRGTLPVNSQQRVLIETALIGVGSA